MKKVVPDSKREPTPEQIAYYDKVLPLVAELRDQNFAGLLTDTQLQKK